MSTSKQLTSFLLAASLLFASCNTTDKKLELDTSQVTQLVQEAYFHSFPIVENYKAMYAYSIDSSSLVYSPMNTVLKNTRLFTPEDKFVVSPNNDTYYTTGALDLRAEPVIIKVPEVKDRYYSFQLTSMVTDNFGYIGTNTTGNEAGIFAVTSPNFKGKLPDGVKQLNSPSEIVGLFGRTQVNSQDPEDVKTAISVQDQYEIGGLHKFYPEYQPKVVDPIKFPKYEDGDMATPKFFALLNFLLQYIELSESEEKIFKKFEAIGIHSGDSYTFYDENPEFQVAIEKGIKAGIEEINEKSRDLGKIVNGWTMFPLGDYFGENYVDRTKVAKMGIYANSPFEAFYPVAFIDDDGEKLNGQNNYSITFSKDSLPPVKYFWSLTMYDSKTQLLSENEIKRYSIGDRTKSLKFNSDGSLTLYVGATQPKSGSDNWLPAPNGEFNVMLRLYGPQESVLSGLWTPPPFENY